MGNSSALPSPIICLVSFLLFSHSVLYLVPLLATHTSPLCPFYCLRIGPWKEGSHTAALRKSWLHRWWMEQLCLSPRVCLVQDKLFPLWGKQVHVHLTLVLRENISGAALCSVIQGQPLYSVLSRSTMKQLVMPSLPTVGLGLGC